MYRRLIKNLLQGYLLHSSSRADDILLNLYNFAVSVKNKRNWGHHRPPYRKNTFLIKLCFKDFLNLRATILKVFSETVLLLKVVFFVLYILARLTCVHCQVKM